MSWRRFGSLLAHLPRESHFVTAIAGEQAAWGSTEHLLAALFDAVQTGNWLLASAHSKSKVQRPKRLIRPGERDPDRIGGLRGYTIEEMDRILRESNGPNSPYKAVSATAI